MVSNNYSLEEDVFNNFLMEDLKTIIEKLPEKQKRRIKKYYFEDMTLENIAREEKCSKVAIKYSIDIGIKKILQHFKDNK